MPPEEASLKLSIIFDIKKNMQAIRYVYVNHPADDDVGSDHTHVYPFLNFDTMEEAKKSKESLRVRLNRCGVKGAGKFAISIYDTGLAGFMFYAKHSGHPLYNGTPEEETQYAESPVYIKPKDFNQDEDDHAEHINAPLKAYKTLTPYNIVKVMRRFCRLNRIGVRNFKVVFADLMEKSQWRPAMNFPRPIAPEIIREFEIGTKDTKFMWGEWLNSTPPQRW